MSRTAQTVGLSTTIAFLSLAVLGLPGCGGNSTNAAPRITPIPSQSAPGGGATFSLDLSTFVTDREGSALVFAVASGGGSFAGSVYSNVFDTIGSYSVAFSVTDAAGKSASSAFDVTVTTANLAVVIAGDDLELLDTDTRKFLPVTAAAGFADTFRASLPTGQVLYDRTVGGTRRLFAYDSCKRRATTLANENGIDATYRAHTAAGLVLFERRDVGAGDTDLWGWDTVTGVIEAISSAAGEFDGNPVVSTSGLVFFERGSAGQTDIWRYDPVARTAAVVSADANGETLQAALPGDAVVFSRVGPGGERDLHRFAAASGLVEIGADVPSLAALTKEYEGQTAAGHVVFEALTATRDLYVWDPATGTTRAVATTGVDETFVGVNANGQVLYRVAASPTNGDLRLWDTNTNTDVAVSTNAANDVFNGLRADGDVIFTRETGTGKDLFVFDTTTSTVTTLAAASADDYVFGKVLGNERVAYTLLGAGGGVFVIDPSTLTVNTVSAVAGATFAGEGESGDAIARVPVGAQSDLVLWDASAAATVTISADPGADEFQAAAAGGAILFTRVAVGTTAKELFLWSPATGTAAQLTSAGVDHAVSALFSASIN